MAPEAIQDITSVSEHIALGIYPVLLQESWVICSPGRLEAEFWLYFLAYFLENIDIAQANINILLWSATQLIATAYCL